MHDQEKQKWITNTLEAKLVYKLSHYIVILCINKNQTNK